MSQPSDYHCSRLGRGQSRGPLCGAVVALLGLFCGVASAQVSLKGRVLDVRSEPLPRALVEVLEPESRRDLLVRVVEGRPEPEAIVQSMAGALGEFEIELPGAGPWRLVVSAPGYLPQLRIVRPLPAQQVLPPAILQEAAVEQVDLKGTDAQPAAGAWVEVERRIRPPTLERYSHFTGWVSEEVLGFADDKGTFYFVRGRSERLVFRVRMADASMRLAIGAGQETPAVDQAIQYPVQERSLRFTDARGPVASALVVIDGRPLALTDRSGRVRVPLRRASQVEVLARNGVRQAWSLQGYSLPGGADDSGRQASGIDREVIELTLSASSDYRGQIRSAGGDPVSGALALVEGRLIRADSQGRLEFSLRHRGRVNAWIGAPGHLWRTLTLEELDRRRSVHSWSLTQEFAVRGIVVGKDRQPLANVDVAVTRIQGADTPVWARSDSLGRFSISGLAANEYHTARPAWPRQGLGSRTFRSSEGTRQNGPVRLELAQPRRVRGTVISERGPVAGATVHLRVAGVRPEPRTTDSSGTFSARAAVGELTLRVSAMGLADSFLTLNVPPGDGGWDLGEVLLSAGSSVTVSVRGDEGEAVEGALIRVEARRSVGSNRSVGARSDVELMTDQSGIATLRRLSEGDELTLVASGEGYARETVRGIVIPRDEDVEIILSPGFDLRGRVVDVDGSPLADAFVGISPLGSEEAPKLASPYTGSDGVIEIVGVPAGGYRVWARALDRAEIEPIEIEVRLGEEPDEFELRVPESASVFGAVHSDRGDALAEMAVVIAGQFARTDSEGSFELEHVRLGDQTVELRSPSGRRLTSATTVERGRNSLDLIFPDSLRLEGRVVASDGSPVEGAQVRFAERAPAKAAETDSQGRFVLADVRRGRGRLIATLGEASGSSDWIDVETAPAAIEIVLTPRSRLQGQVTGWSREETADAFRVFGERLDADSELISVDRRRNSGIAADGSFELPGLAPGTWRVRLVRLRSRGGGQTVDERTVTVSAGGPASVDLYAQAQEMPEAADRLQGSVVVDGRPASGLWLQLRSTDGSAFWTRAEPSGHFEFTEAASGRYALHSGDPGTVLHPLFELALPRSAPLDVQVERWVVQGIARDRATGEPVAAQVRFLTGIEGSAEPRHPAPEGRFRLEALASRPFMAEVTAAGFRPYRVEVRSSMELEIDLEPQSP